MPPRENAVLSSSAQPAGIAAIEAAVAAERERCAQIVRKFGQHAASRGIGNLRLQVFAEEIAAEISKGSAIPPAGRGDG